MAIRVTHSKVSGKPQGSDPARVYGNHWDENHVIEGLTPGVDVQPHDATLDALSGKSLTGTGSIVLSSAPVITAPTGIVKADVGLGNVDNTSDAGKPVSTATQTALDGKQPLDSDLTAIAALSTTTYGRALLTLANATALAAEVDGFFLTPAEGNAAYQPLDSDLTAIAALSTTSYGRSLLALANATALAAEVDSFFLTPAEGNAAYQPLDADLTALAGNSTDGLWAHTGAGAGAARTLTAPAAGLTISNPAGVAGNPTFALANDLAALEGLSANGLVARTATDTMAARTLTGPAEGITVTNGGGVAGNPTLALANDLSALEALASTGLAARTGTDTWAQRTLTAGATGAIVITNGNGVSGNPTVEVDTTAWTTYTPTITASSGTFTSVSGAGRYKKIGKTFYWGVTVTVTTVGTATGNIVVPFPASTTAIAATAQGINGINLSTGSVYGAVVSASGTLAQIGVGTIANQVYFAGGVIEIQ